MIYKINNLENPETTTTIKLRNRSSFLKTLAINDNLDLSKLPEKLKILKLEDPWQTLTFKSNKELYDLWDNDSLDIKSYYDTMFQWKNNAFLPIVKNVAGNKFITINLDDWKIYQFDKDNSGNLTMEPKAIADDLKTYLNDVWWKKGKIVSETTEHVFKNNQ